MANEELIQRLRAELLDLERTYKRMTFEEAARKLGKIQDKLKPLIDYHQQAADKAQADIEAMDGLDQEYVRAFADESKSITRLQMKCYKVQSLIYTRHLDTD